MYLKPNHITTMQKVLVIICFIIISSCNSKSVWTDQYERKQYQQIDLGVKQSLFDNAKRKQLVTYIIKRLKAELPAGIESVSSDSLKRLSVKIGREYAYAHPNQLSGLTPHRVVWSKELEDDVRAGFLKGVTEADRPMQIKGCDCVIMKLKKIYPNSVIIPFPKDTLVKLSVQCRNELLGNISKK
jgi:hypothetical protein